MEAVINKIISIEMKAQEVLDAANKEKEKKHKEMLARIEELKNKILHDADRKVKELRQRDLDEAKQEAEAYVAMAEERLQKMQQFADDHRELWRDELVRAVLER